MPKNPTSPLSAHDLNALTALAKKANAHGRRNGYTPMYVALDGGDRSHPDGWLLLTWPALNGSASHCVELIFAHIAAVVMAEFNAQLVVTDPQEAPNAPQC